MMASSGSQAATGKNKNPAVSLHKKTAPKTAAPKKVPPKKVPPRKEPKVLSLDALHSGLSSIQRTADAEGFAFAALCVDDQELEDVSILHNFRHIRHLRARNNEISDVVALTKMASLVTAELAHNAIQRLPLFPNAFLQLLDVSHNRIGNLTGFGAPTLTYLKLDGNCVTSLAGISACKTLQRLDANENQLTSTQDLHDLPSLQVVQLGDNEITEVTAAGLQTLPALEVLNLAGNKLAEVGGSFHDSCACMKVLDLSYNKLSDVETLSGLQTAANLERINLTGNTGLHDYAAALAAQHPQLKAVDGNPVSR